MKKMIRLIAMLLLVILCLAACAPADEPDTDLNDAEGQPTDTSDTSDTSDTELDNSNTEETKKPVASLSASDALIIANQKQTGYKMVIDSSASKKVENIANAFAAKFASKSGASINITDSSDGVKEKEILVNVSSRNEGETVYNKITAPEKKGYRIEAVGSKIVVAAGDETYLEMALDLLASAIRPCDNGAYGIEKDYVGLMDIANPVTSPTGHITTTYTGTGNRTVVANKATSGNYKSFVKELGKMGFKTYTTNKIGDVQFGTYYIDSQFGQVAAYTRYSPEDSCYKVTYGPLGYLPNLDAEALSSAKVMPSLTQVMVTAGSEGNSAPGMSMAVQCEDGSFIIFDGGNNSQSDKETLYNFLVENTPNGGKPIIAAWVITHAHGDHMGLANKFISEYKDNIDLRMAVYNFPDWDNISLSYEGGTAGSKQTADYFINLVRSEFPQANHWVAHTGEVMHFPGVEMEILFNSEEYATGIGLNPNGSVDFGSCNNTNVITRLTINGTTVVLLGDSMETENKWMADNYGEAIKSDILQLAHHGSNGGELTLYQTVDPDICIWPVEERRMLTNMQGSIFNRYLAGVGEFANERQRQHFSHDTLTTFNCTNNGPVVKK